MRINGNMPQSMRLNSDNLYLLLLKPSAPFQNTRRHRQRSRLVRLARRCSCAPAACSCSIQKLRDNRYLMPSISQNAFRYLSLLFA